MPEARDHRVAPGDMSPELVAAQRQQVRLDHRQGGVRHHARRQPTGRPDDGADVDASAQQLLQDAPTGAPGAAEQQDRVLIGASPAASISGAPVGKIVRSMTMPSPTNHTICSNPKP